MTEAEKEICKLYLDDLDKHHACNEYKLLMQMLEQEPCEDCISRKDALSDEGLGEFHYYEDYSKMRNYLKSLPSVQPRANNRVKTELSGIKAELKQDAGGDYISRAFLIDRLLEKVKTQRSTIEIVDKLIPLIKELPSVTPQEPNLKMRPATEQEQESVNAYIDSISTAIEPKVDGDCISREAVMYYIQAHIHEIITESGIDKNEHTNKILSALINGVRTMPPAKPQAPKPGHWRLDTTDPDFRRRWYCPHCGNWQGYGEPPYCPWCGKRVLEEGETDE